MRYFINLMRSKIFSFGILLWFSNLAIADTITSGSVGLIKPSTGTVDASRSWGDKLNFNFEVITDTFDVVISSILAVENTAKNIFSTQVVNGQIYGEDVAQGTLASSHVISGTFLRDSPGVLRSSHTAGKQKYYQVTIGSVGANPDSADILDNGISGLNSALVIGQLMGMTMHQSTSFVSIFLNPDTNFSMNGGTLPFGATLVCGDSTTISPVGISSAILDVYGQIGRLGNPCVIDLQGRGYSGEMIRLRSKSR
jgi:hypothetical protein